MNFSFRYSAGLILVLIATGCGQKKTEKSVVVQKYDDGSSVKRNGNTRLKEKPIDRVQSKRGFFSKMDSLSTYKCVCQESKAQRDIYIYLSNTDTLVNGQSSFFVGLSDTTFIQHDQLDLVFWKGDSLFYRKFGYFRQVTKIFKERGKEIKFSRSDSTALFLVFNQAKKGYWESGNLMAFSGPISIEGTFPTPADTIFTFVSRYKPKIRISHSRQMNRMKVSKQNGIMSFLYYDGYEKFCCSLER
jgi:hypothetical protein